MPDLLFGSLSYTWPLYAIALLAYCLGSIPFGLLLSKFAGKTDPRTVGSGNIGATNVLRAGNKGLAAATLGLDLGKGFIATFAGSLYGPDCSAVAALAVVLGHMFPIWLKFKGGKGVATTFGVIFVLSWPVGLASALIWLLVLRLSGFSSLSALIALISAPGLLFILLLFQPGGETFSDLPGTAQNVETFSILTILIIAKHLPNIRRLLARRESKVKFQS